MRRVIAVLMFALCALVQVQAQAQSPYPSKPVKLIVAFPPGGSTDVTARLLASKLQDKWGQPVVVENRPGAGANIGTAFVAHAAPDGHTLLLATTALAISPSTSVNAGYDALKDFAPVMMVSTIANVLVVHPSVPAATIGEFIAYAKAHPGKLNFAAPGASSGQRMTFELIKQLTGTDVVMVPYAGGTPALQAVLGGQVEAMIVNVVEASTYVRAGKLRALATTTARRAALLPEVPTLAELKLPEATFDAWYGFAAPARTPQPVIDRLVRDVSATMADPALQAQLRAQGMEPVVIGAAAFRSQMENEISRYRALAHRAGIAPE